MRRRGSTLAECLFTLALCVTVMGASTLLYSHASSQTLDSVALVETGDGCDRLGREINFLIGNAIEAEVQSIGGRSVLKLTMPAVRGARNADGFYDQYSASYTHPRLGEVSLAGGRIWLYCGSNSAAVSTLGDVPLLARRADDATPSLTDVDWLWTYRDGAGKTVRRSPGATSFVFTMSGSVVSWTISARMSAGTTSRSFDANDEKSFRDFRLDGSTLLRLEKPQ